MRFRASIMSDMFPRLLAHISMLDTMAEGAVLILSIEHIRIVVRGDNESVETHCTIVNDEVFADVRCESRLENVIGLRVNVENLVNVLRPPAEASQMLLRLTSYEGMQYLRAEMRAGEETVAMRDVPIQLFTRNELLAQGRYTGLEVPPVAVSLPNPRALRSVLSRMASMDRSIRRVTLGMEMGRQPAGAAAVSGGGDEYTASLVLSLEGAGDSVVRQLKTSFSGLRRAGRQPAAPTDEDGGAGGAAGRAAGDEAARRGRARCCLSPRLLGRTLHRLCSISGPLLRATLGIVPDRYLLLHVEVLEGGAISGVISVIHAIAPPEDEDEEEGEAEGAGDGAEAAYDEL